MRGPTRLRRLGEAFSKDLVPGNRHEPGLGGIGEPRAGTIPGWDTPADAADKHQPTRLRMLAFVGRGLNFSPLGKRGSPTMRRGSYLFSLKRRKLYFYEPETHG